MKDEWSFDELADELMEDPVVRRSAIEHGLKRKLAQTFDTARRRQGLSIRKLAKEMGSSPSQVQRLLNPFEGTSTLASLVKIADALNLDLKIQATPREGT